MKLIQMTKSKDIKNVPDHLQTDNQGLHNEK